MVCARGPLAPYDACRPSEAACPAPPTQVLWPLGPWPAGMAWQIWWGTGAGSGVAG